MKAAIKWILSIATAAIGILFLLGVPGYYMSNPEASFIDMFSEMWMQIYSGVLSLVASIYLFNFLSMDFTGNNKPEPGLPRYKYAPPPPPVKRGEKIKFENENKYRKYYEDHRKREQDLNLHCIDVTVPEIFRALGESPQETKAYLKYQINPLKKWDENRTLSDIGKGKLLAYQDIWNVVNENQNKHKTAAHQPIIDRTGEPPRKNECYKTNKECRHNCPGQCRESC